MTSTSHTPEDRSAARVASSASAQGVEERQPSRFETALDRLSDGWRRYDTVVYALFACWCTLYAASLFYGYMLVQTGGVWSAPLDDVFIHFDYARAFARGHPFEWSEGNGYSSGNTSLTYPIVLALGYWLGFRSLALMIWAACVACLSIYGFLLAVGELPSTAPPDAETEPERRWTRLLIPPAILSMGALDWTLFSGMENAFHLGIWGATLTATLWLTRAEGAKAASRRAWICGTVGALLVATRPESAVCVASFGFYASWYLRKRGVIQGFRGPLRVLLGVGLPGVVFLIAHGVTNYALTGEWSANGAIAKVFLNNPFMTAGDKLERYGSLLGYIIPRLTQHHFSQWVPFGWMIPAVALVPLLSRRLRPISIMMWSQIVGWMLVVSLNNQLRWHNARYAMPAVAWMLVLAALGIGHMLVRVPRGKTLAYASYPYRVAAALGLIVAYWTVQSPRMKDQIWFFGRASRNILEQHVTAGTVLRKLEVKRVLVGDAGAMTYIADRPGLDLIGLGGFHAYPFARSTVHGLGASIELIERMPENQRPDHMAIYPSWWGDLPTYFGHYLTSIPVHGNVICGGAEKVLYRANWVALDRTGAPRTLRDGERVVDELDVADLLSEKQHDYNFPQPKMGFVRYRVLADPDVARRDLFDAGRIIPPGHPERAKMRAPSGGGRLIIRVAPEHNQKSEVRINGKLLGEVTSKPLGSSWQEVSLRLPADLRGEMDLELLPKGGDTVHYHLWVVEQAP